MRHLVLLSGFVLTACTTLQGALRPTGIDIEGRQVLALPKTGDSAALEAALSPARGQHVRVRVEEGATFGDLQLLLVIASAVGVNVVELEHEHGCRHDFHADPNPVEVVPPVFTVAIAPEGFYFATTLPPPPSDTDATGPTIATVDGALPYDALDTLLRKRLPALPPMDVAFLAAQPGIKASEVLRTWDVLQRQPRVRKVTLASF